MKTIKISLSEKKVSNLVNDILNEKKNIPKEERSKLFKKLKEKIEYTLENTPRENLSLLLLQMVTQNIIYSDDAKNNDK